MVGNARDGTQHSARYAAITATPPQPVPIFSGFDYVTVDAARGRVYAAHSASQALTIVDAATGKVLGQDTVGPLHGSPSTRQTATCSRATAKRIPSPKSIRSL